MEKVIDFEPKFEEEPGLFTMHHDENGVLHKTLIVGDETFSTGCPMCGRSHTFDFETFIKAVYERGLYGTQYYCPECSAKRTG